MKKVIGLIAMACLTASMAFSQAVVSKVQDKSVAFRVYNGYTGTLSYAVGSDTSIQTNIITCDGLATTLLSNDALTNGTIVLLAANVAACTNQAGTKSLTVDSAPSLAADSVIGRLLPGTYTAVSGKWLEILWDTDVALHYDLYFPGKTYGSGAYKISKIIADPTGTGNVTASIYEDGTLIARKVITSPVYVNPATFIITAGAYTNTYGVDATCNLDWDVGIRSLGAKPVIVRVSRATTATTGVIAAVIE